MKTEMSVLKRNSQWPRLMRRSLASPDYTLWASTLNDKSIDIAQFFYGFEDVV